MSLLPCPAVPHCHRHSQWAFLRCRWWQKNQVSQITDTSTQKQAFLQRTLVRLLITSSCNRYVSLALTQPRIAPTRHISTSQWRCLCAADRRTRIYSLVFLYSLSACANCGRFDCLSCWKLEEKKTQTCLQSLNARRPQVPPAYRHP